MTAPRGDRGAATLLAVACLGLLLLIGCALGVVAAMITAHRTAQAAADLAALAAAGALADGDDGCAEASAIAEENGATLTGCAIDGFEATVEVEVTGPRWLGQSGDLSAEARAGPVGTTVTGGSARTSPIGRRRSRGGVRPPLARASPTAR